VSKRARKAAPGRKRGAASSTRRAVETALASLAHDIRTPLTGILALSDLLVASDLPERERGWARSIRGAADHLAQMTSVVLDAVKAGRAGLVLRKNVFAPRRLAEEVAAAFSARAGAAGLTADVAIASDLPAEAVGDPVRLRAALENLTDNAVKFTPRGRVGFSVRAQRAPRGRVLLHFAVSDTGIGLTRQEIARLFRPFAQANRDVPLRFGGTGLGLALVKRLAKAMGGDLAVTSKKGEGSTFTLTVSLVNKRGSRKVAQSVAAAPVASDASLRILCAEDNPYGRVVLNAMLTGLGHRVDFASTGEAAVNAVARGGYDLVLMDVTLPDFDGLEATRRIRALRGDASRMPIIGISARVSEADKTNALAAGMTHYLTKPVTTAALAEAVDRIALQRDVSALPQSKSAGS
jgi:CheY-like chemotaxis protein/nitrogen-specific signal transduction histidine kinase